MNDDQATYTVSTLRRRRRRNPPPSIRKPDEVYDLIRPLVKDVDREHFYGVYLNTRHHVIAVELISVGSLNASIVHPREVFVPAFQYRAATLVVAHNHPSGETDPSDDDLKITRRLSEAGELLGIPLLDHVIVANGSWTSMKEEGHL